METKDFGKFDTNALVEEFTSKRKILLIGEINDAMAAKVILTLWKLKQEDPDEPIYLFIDSNGGSVPAGLSIVDAINYIKPKVNTFCYGKAASMGAVILASGHHRVAFKNSLIMIHQPLSYLSEGFIKQSDLSESAKTLENTRNTLEDILTKSTKGKTSLEEMHKACDKDNYLTAEQALKMGLIDEILDKEE